MNKVINGNSLEELKKFPDNYFHSVVTDPPYGLVSIVKRFGKENSAPAKFGTDGAFQRTSKGFMGKEWDGSGIEYNTELWKEVFRVLKNGGYLLAFGGTRTHHKLTTAIEDAGFEIRDMIAWVYGSGFPKSHNIGKAIDITIPSTEQAKQWDGWGTALKPALEPITMARKPFKTSVAENVLTNGVGGINIDGCRVRTDDDLNGGQYRGKNNKTDDGHTIFTDTSHTKGKFIKPLGRFPANFIHDGSDEVKDLFPYTKSGGGDKGQKNSKSFFGNMGGQYNSKEYNANIGSASRFFYCAKASKKDRNEGLDGKETKANKNNHPTVKPTDLMRYLVRLVTPKDGIILDPFMGSGSTGKACALEGFKFVGIDLDKDYCEIAKARIDKAIKDKKQAEAQTKLF